MTNSMEIIIKEPTKFLDKIEWNFEELKAELIARTEKYRNITYTKDTAKEAKADKAFLNKTKKAFNDGKISVKKQVLNPYNPFEIQMKELMSLVDEPINEIDVQLKAFETAAKEAKRADITAFFDNNVGELGEVLKLADIFDDRWLNATFKIKDVDSFLIDLFAKTTSDLAIIDNLDTQYTQNIKDVYLKTRDLSQAFNEKARLEEQAKRLAEMERLKLEREAKEKAAQDKLKEQMKDVGVVQANGSTAEYQAPVEEKTEKVDVDTGEILEDEPETEMLKLVVFVNEEQKTALRSFLIEQEIKTEMQV